jgi:hypothetical protein
VGRDLEDVVKEFGGAFVHVRGILQRGIGLGGLLLKLMAAFQVFQASFYVQAKSLMCSVRFHGLVRRALKRVGL